MTSLSPPCVPDRRLHAVCSRSASLRCAKGAVSRGWKALSHLSTIRRGLSNYLPAGVFAMASPWPASRPLFPAPKGHPSLRALSLHFGAPPVVVSAHRWPAAWRRVYQRAPGFRLGAQRVGTPLTFHSVLARPWLACVVSLVVSPPREGYLTQFLRASSHLLVHGSYTLSPFLSVTLSPAFPTSVSCVASSVPRGSVSCVLSCSSPLVSRVRRLALPLLVSIE